MLIAYLWAFTVCRDYEYVEIEKTPEMQIEAEYSGYGLDNVWTLWPLKSYRYYIDRPAYRLYLLPPQDRVKSYAVGAYFVFAVPSGSEYSFPEGYLTTAVHSELEVLELSRASAQQGGYQNIQGNLKETVVVYKDGEEIGRETFNVRQTKRGKFCFVEVL